MATTNLTAAQQQAANAALASVATVQVTGAAASAAALANKASSASDDFGFYDSVWDSFLGNNDKYKWSKLDGVEAGTKSRNVSAQAELANSLLKPSNKTKMLKSFQTSILDENLRSIGGMPATGVAASDKPMVDGGPGRVFMEHHITNGHFITFSPGRLKWKLTDNDKDDILGFQAPEGAMENLGDFSKGLYKRIMSGQLAKFIYEPVAYRSAVGMAHAMAIEFMGLNGTMCKIGSRNMKLGDMTSTDWAEVGQDVKGLFANGTYGSVDSNGRNKQDFVSFYVDGTIDVSDNVSNSVGSSMIKDMVQAMQGNGMLQGVMTNLFNEDKAQGLVTALIGNPIIPDVWQDTVYDRSYSVTFKFAARYGDPLSIFLDCIVPLNQIMMLALPVGTGGFIMSPFVLKAFSAGGINSESCIISDISISRNMNTLNHYGMPTELEVQCQIRDLNPRLFREKDGFAKGISHLNTAYTPFLATLAGLNTATLPNDLKKRLDDIMTAKAAKERKQAWGDSITFGWKSLIGSYDQTKDVIGYGRRRAIEAINVAKSFIQ